MKQPPKPSKKMMKLADEKAAKIQEAMRVATIAEKKQNDDILYQVERGRPFFPKHFFREHYGRSEPAQFLAFGGKNGKFPWNWIYKSGRHFHEIEDAIKYLGNPGGKLIIPEGYFPRTTAVPLQKYQCVEGVNIASLPPPTGSDDIPDQPPTELYGSVFVSAGTNDMFSFETNSYGSQLKNVGVKYTGATSGTGVKADSNGERGIVFGSLDNIMVLGHDASHYAFDLKNCIHTELSRLTSFGGPILRMKNDSVRSPTSVNYGNFEGKMIYGYVRVPVTDGYHPYHFESVNGWFNLFCISRMQCNHFPWPQTPPTNHESLFMKGIRNAELNHLDLEGGPYISKHIKLEEVVHGSTHTPCTMINFTSPYFFGGYGAPAADLTNSQGINFIGGYHGVAYNWTSGPITFIGPWANYSDYKSKSVFTSHAGSEQWHEGITSDMINVTGQDAQAFLATFNASATRQYLLRSTVGAGTGVELSKNGLFSTPVMFGANQSATAIFPCDSTGAIGDNIGALGNDAHRFSYIRGVTIAQGDSVFDNKMRITEGEKLGLGHGLVFLSKTGKVVMLLDGEGNLKISGIVQKVLFSQDNEEKKGKGD